MHPRHRNSVLSANCLHMGEFKKFGGFKGKGGFKRQGGDRPRFGGGSRPAFGGGRDRERSEMFEATCDQCGRRCEVPFRPSGNKPVYCNNCFSGQQGDQRPSFDRPRQDRFEKRDSFSFGAPKAAQAPTVSTAQFEDLKRQISALHTKVDSLVTSLAGNMPTPAPAPAPAPAASVTHTVTAKKKTSATSVTKTKAAAQKPATKKKASAKQK